MITYYLYRKSTKQILPLGEISFNKFYVEDGFYILDDMVNENDPILYNFIVRRSDSNKEFTIEEFLIEIEKYELKLDK